MYTGLSGLEHLAAGATSEPAPVTSSRKKGRSRIKKTQLQQPNAAHPSGSFRK